MRPRRHLFSPVPGPSRLRLESGDESDPIVAVLTDAPTFRKSCTARKRDHALVNWGIPKLEWEKGLSRARTTHGGDREDRLIGFPRFHCADSHVVKLDLLEHLLNELASQLVCDARVPPQRPDLFQELAGSGRLVKVQRLWLGRHDFSASGSARSRSQPWSSAATRTKSCRPKTRRASPPLSRGRNSSPSPPRDTSSSPRRPTPSTPPCSIFSAANSDAGAGRPGSTYVIER